jgi:hypothetical protein
MMVQIDLRNHGALLFSGSAGWGRNILLLKSAAQATYSSKRLRSLNEGETLTLNVSSGESGLSNSGRPETRPT